MITRDEVKKFREAVGRASWLLDFSQFKEATGFTDRYSEEKWEHLKFLARAVGNFDDETLVKILNAVKEKETNNVS